MDWDGHVLHVLREASGGMLTHLAELLPPLGQRGVRLAVAGPPESLRCLWARVGAGPAGFSTNSLPVRDGIRPWADAAAVNRLRRVVLRLAPDVVHAHGHKAGITAAIALAAVPRALRPALVITVHNFLPQRSDPVLAWAERQAARWALGRASRVIAVSRVLEEFARGLAGQRRPDWCRVVRNGLGPLQTGDPGEAAGGRDAPLTLAAPAARAPAPQVGPVVVTCMARLVRTKGVEHLVEAAALLDGHVPPVEIRVAGDGPERARLVARARRLGVEGRVRFVGFAADPARVWAASHLAVLPWMREGSSYSALEAMAAGLPVITFDCPGAREVVSEEAGLLVAEGAPALARAIARLASDPEARSRLGRRARERVAEWNRIRMAEATLGVYREAAGQR